jgi:hypothetical protein
MGCLKSAGIGALIVLGVGVCTMVVANSGTSDLPRENPGRISRFPMHTDSVIMDYRRREIRVYGDLPSASAKRGDTTYVWAFFTNPNWDNGQSSWSALPVPVVAKGGKLEATLDFHWSTNPEIPQNLWRAFVFAGDSPEGVQIRAQERDKSAAISQPGITRLR